MVSGTIRNLRINIPWSGILTATLNIYLDGVEFVVQPRCRQEVDPSTTAMSTAEIAQSFVLGESSGDLGVGKAEVVETALLQRALDAVIANLSLELSGFSITFKGRKLFGVPPTADLSLTLERLSYGPSDTKLKKDIRSRGLSIYLIYPLSRRTSDSTERACPSTETSRSASISSEDASMLQSTLFTREEGRSLYMSALSVSSPSIYQSTIQYSSEASQPMQIRPEDVVSEEDGDQSDLPDHKIMIASSSDGISGFITADKPDELCIDISAGAFEAQINSKDMASICACIELYSFPSSQSDTKPQSVSLCLKISNLSLTYSASFPPNFICVDKCQTSDFRLAKCRLSRVFLQYDVSGERQLIVGGMQITVAGGDMLKPIEPKSAFFLRLDSSAGNNEIQFCPMEIRADLQQSIPFITEILDTVGLMFPPISAERLGVDMADSNVSLKSAKPWTTQLYCPVLCCTVNIRDVSTTLSISRLKVTLNDQQMSPAADFREVKLMLGEVLLLQFGEGHCRNEARIVSASKPRLRKLGFINYEELFMYAEKDEKSATETLDAVKQRALENAVQYVHVKLTSLVAHIDNQAVAQIYRLWSNLRQIPELWPNMQVAEQTRVPSIMSLHLDSFIVNLTKDITTITATARALAIEGYTALKAVDIVAVNAQEVNVCSRTAEQPTETILMEGLHSISRVGARQRPMLSLRLRRDTDLHRAGNLMCRVGVNDVHFEYRASMQWPLVLSSIFTDSSDDSTSETMTRVIKYAIECSNTSIGLNPCVTNTKGLLYFRKSAITGDLGKCVPDNFVDIQAGVIDLLLIDDVEGGQNDTGDLHKIRRDPVLVALTKLGFVHVANMQTAKIKASLEDAGGDCLTCTLEISGAILTLTSCADSTQTLISLVTNLRAPADVSTDSKYRSESKTQDGSTLDVFQSIDEEAFRDLMLQKKGFHLRKKSPDSESRVELTDPNLLSVSLSAAPIKKAKCSDNLRKKERSSNEDNVGEYVLLMDDQPLDLMDDHFVSPSINVSGNGNGSIPQRAFLRLDIRDCYAIWNIHDGYDWDRTRTAIGGAIDAAVELAQRKVESRQGSWDEVDEDEDGARSNSETEEVGDLLFNSIYISLPAGSKREDITSAINRDVADGLSETASQGTTDTQTTKPSYSTRRRASDTLRLQRSPAHKVRIELSGICAHIDLMNVDVGEIMNRVKCSVRDIEIFDNVSTSTWRKFLTYFRGAGARETNSNMAEISVATVRPVAALEASELVIKAAILPLRLHVDQDTLDFLTRFFDFRDDLNHGESDQNEEIFIQRFEILPIRVQMDYKPKRLDFKGLRSGRTTEFMNFFILEESNMVMRHVVLYGVTGLPRLFQHLNDIWLPDIRSTQLGSVLAGVAPIRSLASFGGSMKNLVLVPINEYQKDGRVVRSLRKGITSFAKTTGIEAVRLGAKLAVGTQGMLEQAEGVFKSNADMYPAKLLSKGTISPYANQPANVRQGVAQAFGGLSRNVATARDALITLPEELHQGQDARAMMRAATRSVPIAVIRPLIGTTEMISKTLLGLRNTMNPEQTKLNDDVGGLYSGTQLTLVEV